ncbi:hypothetical protein D3C80_669550 [compost metagenome]
MHEQKVHARAIAVLARATGITLLVTRAGLPAQAAQGTVLFFRQPVPLVTGCMPELMEQTVLGADQPSLQLRRVGQAFTGFGEQALDRDEMAVGQGQGHRAIQRLQAAAERAAAGIAETAPDLVQAG